MSTTHAPSPAARLMELKGLLDRLDLQVASERSQLDTDALLAKGMPPTSPSHKLVSDRKVIVERMRTEAQQARDAWQSATNAVLAGKRPETAKLLPPANEAYVEALTTYNTYVNACNGHGAPAQPTPAAPAVPTPAPSPAPVPPPKPTATTPPAPPVPSSEEPAWAKHLKQSVADYRAEQEKMRKLLDAGLPQELVEVLTQFTPEELRSRLTSRAQFTDDEVIAVRAILKLLKEQGGKDALAHALRAGNWFDRITWSRYKPAH
jgi:hypothetical protein